ncbi:MAG: NAD(P)/FAD-dependent oxidoreductase [Megasphaera sp.]|jgi:protoporphyrinogen oxidase|nr:NAD(P)/FAD-dependent oxidoreductase [Megasphaera sp.]
MEHKKTAVIIGAGTAGLTAAYELLQKSDIRPIVLESDTMVGGIAKTVSYMGNHLDMGGHRFFSKSDEVIDWWLHFLPIEGSEDDFGNMREADDIDRIMMVRHRVSRIFFLRKFFAYPISFQWETIHNLGILRMLRIGFSYLRCMAHPIKPEQSLEDFFINRFGKELYETFFKDYTAKVWGIPCNQIEPDWGAQRVKGLSIMGTVKHAIFQFFHKSYSLRQKEVETSLIEQFLYPKYGPGQMWQTVADTIVEQGGIIRLNCRVDKVEYENNKVKGVWIEDAETGRAYIPTEYVISTMPVKNLIRAMGDTVPEEVRRVSEGLIYRDFMTAGLLVKRLQIREKDGQLIRDNWIYIQERDVKIGRLQILNNWSPYMVADCSKVWLGLEYFCNEGDSLWNMEDKDFAAFAAGELAKIGIIDAADVCDSTVVRVPKAYPAYFGTYKEMDTVRNFTDPITNLYLIGRNGMHRYNNMDHSMLTAMEAVKNIVNGAVSKENIWNVNVEEEYHEEVK